MPHMSNMWSGPRAIFLQYMDGAFRGRSLVSETSVNTEPAHCMYTSTSQQRSTNGNNNSQHKASLSLSTLSISL